MKIKFLGTGTSQGIPVIGVDHPVCYSKDIKDNRLRSSILIETKDTTIVIDCGPDFRQQMLNSNTRNIDALVFTHEHSDHTAGLDDIRPFTYFGDKTLPLYGQQRVLDSIKKRFDYFFETEDRYPGAPQVKLKPINEFDEFLIKQTRIKALPIIHGKLPILGYRINNFAYITDSTFLSDETYAALQNLDVLVINALREKPHPSHNHLSLAINHINKINPKHTFLTHIGFEMGFHKEMNTKLPKNIQLAYDGLIIEL